MAIKLALTAVLLSLLPSTALAIRAPYAGTPVPLDDCSYAACDFLQSLGWLGDYPPGHFAGGTTLTDLEFAAVTVDVFDSFAVADFRGKLTSRAQFAPPLTAADVEKIESSSEHLHRIGWLLLDRFSSLLIPTKVEALSYPRRPDEDDLHRASQLRAYERVSLDHWSYAALYQMALLGYLEQSKPGSLGAAELTRIELAEAVAALLDTLDGLSVVEGEAVPDDVTALGQRLRREYQAELDWIATLACN